MRANSKPREELGLALIVDGPTRHRKALGLASKAGCCNDHNKSENHKIISERRLLEITIKRRCSKNGFTKPLEIYG